MTKVLFVALGGGVGSALRFLTAAATQHLIGSSFPIGTLVVNVVGCFSIGLLGSALGGPILIREEYRLAVLVGLLGGFTTFSSYGWESFTLANDGDVGRAVGNILLSNALGLPAVWIGYRTAQAWWGV